MATFTAANVSFPIPNIGQMTIPTNPFQTTPYIYIRDGNTGYKFNLLTLIPNAGQLAEQAGGWGPVIQQAIDAFKQQTGVDYLSLPKQNPADFYSAFGGDTGVKDINDLSSLLQVSGNPQPGGNIDISQGQTVNSAGQLVDANGKVIASSVVAGQPANTSAVAPSQAATAANPPIAQATQQPNAAATVTIQPPTVNLQPGSTDTAAVKQLQDWLVSQGYMTQAQVNTGYGTYGPQTTAAVLKYQQDHGVDNSTGPGYWGPRTIAAASGNNQPPINGAGGSSGGTSGGTSGSTTGTPPPNLSSTQLAQYNQLIAAGASPQAALSAVSLIPNQTPTNESGTGLSFDTNYGVTQEQWNQMNDTQRAVIAAAYTAKQQAYQTDGQQLTFADALEQAAKDPNLVAQFADAAKLDAQTFAQNIQQLQQATTSTAQTQQQQFENDRRALAEQQASKGAAYSGFRNQAQEQLGQAEGGIVQSSRAQLQQQLNNATQAFEAKYGTAATNPALANFTDPYASSNYSLSGQYKPTAPTTLALTGALAGDITGSQPIAKQNAINAKATDLYNLANATPSIA